MHFNCKCGERITDQTDRIPYKAHYYRDIDDEEYHEKIVQDISDFIRAVTSGKRDNWIEEMYGSECTKTIENTSVIFDLISKHRMNYEEHIYQCEKCGTVFFAVPGSNEMESYHPTKHSFELLFKSR